MLLNCWFSKVSGSVEVIPSRKCFWFLPLCSTTHYYQHIAISVVLLSI
uniref:Uncharacterized protein n=1 Tax=Arundo donax TaxID=35708 RepID=A0A0A8YNK5_ARUDO